MKSDLILASLVVLFGASGTYLLLPHKHGARTPKSVHAAGAGLAGLALLLFAVLWTPPPGFTSDVSLFVAGLFFYACAFGAVAAAVASVTSRDPTHSALWFAAVVLATSGLFLKAGASFLAVGTVIVYAGAIVVTFLFVIMLAQMEGRAGYDRAARMPFRTTWICFLLFLGIVWSILHVEAAPAVTPLASVPPASAGSDTRLPTADMLSPSWVKQPAARANVAEVINRAIRPTAKLYGPTGLVKPHVAGLGETLYTDHLVTVELAGGLLFAALIGALAIATPKPPVRPGDSGRGSADSRASTATPTKVNV